MVLTKTVKHLQQIILTNRVSVQTTIQVGHIIKNINLEDIYKKGEIIALIKKLFDFSILDFIMF